MDILTYLVLGVVAGVFGGFFGVGGGIIVVPALVIGFAFTQPMAQGTMIAALLPPTFIFAAWKYYQHGNVNVPAAIWLAIGMTAGALVGAVGVQTVAGPMLKKLFGIFVVIVGMKLIFW